MILKASFRLLVAGPSMAGKSVFVAKLINFLKEMTDVRFSKIIWCLGEKNAKPSNLKWTNKIKFIEGIPDFDKLTSKNNKKHVLIILDDLMNESNNEKVCEIFTRGSHHKLISIILITQNIFYKGKFCRDISLNSNYIAVFKNPRDKSQFSYLARQIYPENPKALQNAYIDATRKPHGYLFLDLTQDTNDLLRFKTNIFPNDKVPIVYAPMLSYEKIKEV